MNSSSYIVGTENARTNIIVSLLWIKFTANSNISLKPEPRRGSTLRISIRDIDQRPRVALEENTHNKNVLFSRPVLLCRTWLEFHIRLAETDVS